ncbi:MAG TPA: Ppx/GppA phosphatase family protein [Candidatus Cybelea sp.]|nr:Ppx/GppA phosphatase family protein [Candidatus Cybelea sp.]
MTYRESDRERAMPPAATPRRGRLDHTFAALDLGTNNCRLLIARAAPGGFRVVDAFSRIVRLGEGLTHSGRLSDEAIARTIGALKVCAGKLARRNVTRSRAVATEACRRAANCGDFIETVRAETGIDMEIISTAEEARLALSGCAPLLDRDNRFAMVFDIGGGSTELMWLGVEDDGATALISWLSVPIGVVTLAERHGGITIDDALFARMVEEFAAHLSGFEDRYHIRRHLSEHPVQLLGTSGTVTTLAGVHLGLPRYDRAQVDGIWLEADQVAEVTDRLVRMQYRERAHHPCIGPDRADLVIAGCAILSAIQNTWPFQRLRVADRGVREGVLFDLMNDADGELAAAGA